MKTLLFFNPVLQLSTELLFSLTLPVVLFKLFHLAFVGKGPREILISLAPREQYLVSSSSLNKFINKPVLLISWGRNHTPKAPFLFISSLEGPVSKTPVLTLTFGWLPLLLSSLVFGFPLHSVHTQIWSSLGQDQLFSLYFHTVQAVIGLLGTISSKNRKSSNKLRGLTRC